MVIPHLTLPIFEEGLKSNLDWQAWEKISRYRGAFLYSKDRLLQHRIHEGSETTATINDDTRSKEDLYMFQKFWPRPIASFINSFYAKSQESNQN